MKRCLSAHAYQLWLTCHFLSDQNNSVQGIPVGIRAAAPDQVVDVLIATGAPPVPGDGVAGRGGGRGQHDLFTTAGRMHGEVTRHETLFRHSTHGASMLVV